MINRKDMIIQNKAQMECVTKEYAYQLWLDYVKF